MMVQSPPLKKAANTDLELHIKTKGGKYAIGDKIEGCRSIGNV